MARTAITVATQAAVTVNSLSPSDLVPTAVNAGTGNGHTLTTNGQGNRYLIFADLSTGGAITIKAGAEPPAMRAGAGDYVITAPTGQCWIGPFESGRFLQSDGLTINIDVAASTAGSLYAVQLPNNA